MRARVPGRNAWAIASKPARAIAADARTPSARSGDGVTQSWEINEPASTKVASGITAVSMWNIAGVIPSVATRRASVSPEIADSDAAKCSALHVMPNK